MRRPGSAVCSMSAARCYVCRRHRPYIMPARSFDERAAIRAEYLSSVGSLGRSYLASGGVPACGLLPSARNLLPHPPLPGRTNALTLDPLPRAVDFGASYSVAPLPARSTHASSLRRAPSLSLSPGFVLPVVALAPPRYPRTRAVSVIFHRSGVAGGLAMREALPPAG